MEDTLFSQHAERRHALLGLWAVPGLGPKALALLSCQVQGAFEEYLYQPPSIWTRGLTLTGAVTERLEALPTLQALADVVAERVLQAGMDVVFRGDAGYPVQLAQTEDAPPLLFKRGVPDLTPRRRLALVGSRRIDPSFRVYVQAFAARLAREGVGIVSGAARGVDQAAHEGCIEGNGETWAFLGSALDLPSMDEAQAALMPRYLDAGGTLFSELPPGVRASKVSFPRRNRLISGASHAVLMARAAQKSGSRHTALAALRQGRPLLAFPGDPRDVGAAGCNELIRLGYARLCRDEADALEALGIIQARHVPTARGEGEALAEASRNARAAYELLQGMPQSFDAVQAATRLPSAALTSALMELEMMGLVIQHPGKQYERV